MIIESALICLAQNIFYEARSENVPAQYAIAEVTLNRAGHDQEKICKVVFAPWQFSWTAKKQRSPEKIDPYSYDKALAIARNVLKGNVPTDFFTKGATHFHAVYVQPDWAKQYQRTARLGQHIFYKVSK